MTLSITDLISTATPEDFEAKILSVAGTVGLTTTAWQPGGVTRTIIKILAQILGVAAGTANTAQLAAQGVDGLVATIAQGGFLLYAGNVTPDPSVTPGAAPGWLDILADSDYNVQRVAATYATGPVVLTNAAGVAYGPFAPGAYHIANPSTGATYSNTATLTIAASADTSATFAADVAGASSTSAASAITQTVTSLVGVSLDPAKQSGSLVGSNAESNNSLVARCLAKLFALGPKLGPKGAYYYFATTATQPTAQGGGGLSLSGGPITDVATSTDPLTGIITVSLRNANGGQPPRLPALDVTAVAAYIQGSCVPTGPTAVIQGAAETTCTVTCDVWVPAAYASVAANAVTLALNAYLQRQPIGGVVMDTFGNKGVPYAAVLGAIFAGVSYVSEVRSFEINGGFFDVLLSSSTVAIPGTHVIAVHST